MTPFFSIVMPVYNVESYLRKGVDSVLGQDDRDFEIILVDDGAKDTSPQICNEYAERYDFVRVIHKPNGGLASARNAGLEVARGEYVLMPDSDDYIELDTLSAVRQAIKDAAEKGAPQADIVHFDAVRRVEDQAWPVYTDVPEGLHKGEQTKALLDTALLGGDKYILSAWSNAYRRAFLEENSLRFVSEREVLSEDFLFNLCALMVADSVYMLRRNLYHYILRGGSLTQQPKPDMAERYTRLYHELKAYAAAHAADAKLDDKLASFYVMKLIYRNYIHAEYVGRNGSTWEEARKHVRAILRQSEVRSAAKHMDVSRMAPKDRVRAMCMRYGLEGPLAFSYRDKR